jgi:hypothetical protein
VTEWLAGCRDTRPCGPGRSKSRAVRTVHGQAEVGAGVRGEHPGAAHVGYDRDRAARRHRLAGEQRGGLDQVAEAARGNDTGLLEQGFPADQRRGHRRGVRCCRPLAGFRPPGVHGQDGHAGADPAGHPGELARVAERLDVQHGEFGDAVLFPAAYLGHSPTRAGHQIRSPAQSSRAGTMTVRTTRVSSSTPSATGQFAGRSLGQHGRAERAGQRQKPGDGAAVDHEQDDRDDDDRGQGQAVDGRDAVGGDRGGRYRHGQVAAVACADDPSYGRVRVRRDAEDTVLGCGHRGSERLRLPAITVNGKTQPQFATSLRIGQ